MAEIDCLMAGILLRDSRLPMFGRPNWPTEDTGALVGPDVRVRRGRLVGLGYRRPFAFAVPRSNV